MAQDSDDGPMEHTLLVVSEVNVYKIPPRASSGGYKVADWMANSKIWSGRLRVLSKGEICRILLEDPSTGQLFAECPVRAGERDRSVESALDSSRYFVLRIEHETGKHAFIGLGFNERNESFDFNVALSDHEKHLERDGGASSASPSFDDGGFNQGWEGEGDGAASGGERNGGNSGSASSSGASVTTNKPAQAPLQDLRLKEGQTMHINLKKPASSSSGGGGSTGSKGAAGGLKLMPLAPPPGKHTAGVGARPFAPPPQNIPGGPGGANNKLNLARTPSISSYDAAVEVNFSPPTTGRLSFPAPPQAQSKLGSQKSDPFADMSQLAGALQQKSQGK